MIHKGLAYIGVACLGMSIFGGSAAAATMTAAELLPAGQTGLLQRDERLQEAWQVEGTSFFERLDGEAKDSGSWTQPDASFLKSGFPAFYPGLRIFSIRDTTIALVPGARWFDSPSRPSQQFAPVPLPASSWLLGAAAAAWLLMGWLRDMRSRRTPV